MRLPLHYHRLGSLYGPGMPMSGDPGPQIKQLDRSLGQVGLVLVHCWNLGESDGPYPIEPGDRRPGEAADRVAEAHGIIGDVIRPVLEAARGVGLPIFHLGQHAYADRYPGYQRVAADAELQAPAAAPADQPSWSVPSGTGLCPADHPRRRRHTHGLHRRPTRGGTPTGTYPATRRHVARRRPLGGSRAPTHNSQ